LPIKLEAQSLKPEAGFSPQRIVQLSLNSIRNLRQILPRVLQKVRRVAVGFKRSVVLVLLVDKEPPRLGAMSMHLKHGASRLFARLCGELRQHFRNRSFLPDFRNPGYR
jgi:hypothetical protein